MLVNLYIYFLQSCLCLSHILRNSKNEIVPDFPQIPVCKQKEIIFRTYNYFRIKTRPLYVGHRKCVPQEKFGSRIFPATILPHDPMWEEYFLRKSLTLGFLLPQVVPQWNRRVKLPFLPDCCCKSCRIEIRESNSPSSLIAAASLPHLEYESQTFS